MRLAAKTFPTVKLVAESFRVIMRLAGKLSYDEQSLYRALIQEAEHSVEGCSWGNLPECLPTTVLIAQALHPKA